MNIYIPNIDFSSIDKRQLFIATRPFYLGTSWGNDTEKKQKWNIAYDYTDDITKAQVLLIPKPINYYTDQELSELNTRCKAYNIKGFGFVTGDYGKVFKHHSRLFYFRVGGFKKQLTKNNIGLPVAISDIYKSLYNDKEIDVRDKQEIPFIGFCGHASRSYVKRLKDILGFIKKNVIRFFENPLRHDYEPLFASAYERYKLLKTLEASSIVKTNFILRKNYRAGAITKALRKKTNKEYYENIRQSDYVLCVRGAGNFSVRLYETLMMARIPVLVDTDCLLPFVDDINWREHVVWVPWKERKKLDKFVCDFHNHLSPEKFRQLQNSNRSLWENDLSLTGIFNYIRKNMIST